MTRIERREMMEAASGMTASRWFFEKMLEERRSLRKYDCQGLKKGKVKIHDSDATMRRKLAGMTTFLFT